MGKDKIINHFDKWKIELMGDNRYFEDDIVYKVKVGYDIRSGHEIYQYISKDNYDALLAGVYHINIFSCEEEIILLFDEFNNLIPLVKGMEINYEKLTIGQKLFIRRNRMSSMESIRKLEEKRKKILYDIEKANDSLKNTTMNLEEEAIEFFEEDTSKNFYLLEEYPTRKYIKGIHPLAEFSKINIQSLCELLKEYYTIKNEKFDYTTMMRTYRSNYVYHDYYIYPNVIAKLNDHNLFELPYTNDLECEIQKLGIVGIKNGENFLYSPYIKMIGTELVNQKVNYSYVDNCSLEFPFACYDNDLRNIIYSIAYFQKRNNVKFLEPADFQVEITKPFIRMLTR